MSASPIGIGTVGKEVADGVACTRRALAAREPVLIGEVLPRAPSDQLIAIITVVPDAACSDCDHPASVHADIPPDDATKQPYGRCDADGCTCLSSRLEAAGWTPPGVCAMGCR